MTDNSPATDELIAQIEADIKNGTMGEHHVVLSLIARIRAETAKNSGEVVGTVYTMEALPGGDVKYHVSLIKPLPAGTKLYANPAHSRTETIGAREAEIRTHLSAWRRALVIAKEHAEVSPPDIDDKAYWQHEIDALDRALLGGVSHG